MIQAKQRLTGRNGERLVHKVLLQNFAAEVTQRDVNIMWVNQGQETGLPYDIKILKRINHKYVPVKSIEVKSIEVKSTKYVGNRAFKMSTSELRFALQYGLGYIYRLVE